LSVGGPEGGLEKSARGRGLATSISSSLAAKKKKTKNINKKEIGKYKKEN